MLLEVTLLNPSLTGSKVLAGSCRYEDMTLHQQAREAYGVNDAERRAMQERVILNQPGKIHMELRWAEIGLRGLVTGETKRYMSAEDQEAALKLLSSLQSLRQELQVKLSHR